MTVPIYTGAGGGTGWTQLYSVSDMSGAGGVISSGSTLEIESVDWLARKTGAQFEQTANGLEVTLDAGGNASFGVAISDVDGSYSSRAQYMLVARAKIETWGATTGDVMGMGIWRDEGAGALEAIFSGISHRPALSWLAMRRTVTGAYATKVEPTSWNGASVPAYVRWAVLITPEMQLHAFASADSTQKALPDAEGLASFGSTVDSSGTLTSVCIRPTNDFGTFTHLGFWVGPQSGSTVDFRIEAFDIWRRD